MQYDERDFISVQDGEGSQCFRIIDLIDLNVDADTVASVSLNKFVFIIIRIDMQYNT